MRKFFLFVAFAMVAGGVLASGVFLYFLRTGPRMRVQEHLRAYQAAVPLPPRGSVPAVKPATSPDAAKELGTAAAATAAELENGRAYYTYYCVFCHGVHGDGHGPVGESFVPAPPDLRTERVRGMAPPQLMRAMLKGVGHEPVLEMTVQPQYRRELVLYVAALAQGRTERSRR